MKTITEEIENTVKTYPQWKWSDLWVVFKAWSVQLGKSAEGAGLSGLGNPCSTDLHTGLKLSRGSPLNTRKAEAGARNVFPAAATEARLVGTSSMDTC